MYTYTAYFNTRKFQENLILNYYIIFLLPFFAINFFLLLFRDL